MMKTKFMANFANKTLALATVLTMGLALAACSSSDNNDPDVEPGNAPKPMTVTIDGVDKPVARAEYKNLGEGAYEVTLYLTKNLNEQVLLTLDKKVHSNTDIDLTKEEKGDVYHWTVDYVDAERQALIEASGDIETKSVRFTEGKLRFEGDPDDKFKVTLTNGKVQGRDEKEHTFLISYEGFMEDVNFIDLGLSVKWADFNLGASDPEELGDRYAWGEVTTKDEYNWDNYKWWISKEEEMDKYNSDQDFGQPDYRTTLEAKDDIATVFYTSTRYRMPTPAEMKELIERCTWEWKTINNVKGYLVTGPNTNTIFLPTDLKEFTMIGGKTMRIYDAIYWTNTVSEKVKTAHCLTLSGVGLMSGSYKADTSDRCLGLYVRPVRQ